MQAPAEVEFTAVRQDLGDAHTITIERLPEKVALLRIAHPVKSGQRVVVERTGGRLVKIWAVEDDLWSGTSIEITAEALADECGARYIP
ncbi:hypothetical protein [Actinomadura nitritigenes]|uniref:hypothetical protein n=1 Tax=Actinomadura nitritigenes TaxID=134602 RepID=UPI003D8CA13B